DYHNFATELARADYYEAACEILKQGVIVYPKDTDLLADYMMYAHKCGKHDIAKEKYNQLKAIDRIDWSWRSFVFSIDYYIDVIKGQKGDERKATETTIEGLIIEFKEQLGNEEKAYLAEADFLEAIGKREEAIEALKKVVDDNTVAVCTQCCLRYVDRCLEKGDYDEVIQYSKKGITMTEEQESVETTAFWYFWALAADHEWFNENLSLEEPDKGSARKVIKLYDTMLRLEPNNRYASTASKRKRMIASFASIEIPKDETSHDVSQLLQMIKQAQN
ncbi:MAG: hypothetical protein RR304_09835, partial [Bacteroides sp.]